MAKTGMLVVSPEIMEKLRAMVAKGEFGSVSEAVDKCVLYYLERHGDESWRQYVREEIEAGLNETA